MLTGKTEGKKFINQIKAIIFLVKGEAVEPEVYAVYCISLSGASPRWSKTARNDANFRHDFLLARAEMNHKKCMMHDAC